MRPYLLIGFIVLVVGCDTPQDTPRNVSATGVKRAVAKIEVGSDGLTVEQRNLEKRVEMDNKPGSIKHLYVVSAYSGQTLLYSTVDGKVTSSGKRLTPKTVSAGTTYSGDASGWRHDFGMPVNIGGDTHYTPEVLQDDGTYGDSIEYLYWFDQRGTYHQHYVTGGQIVHISDQPITVRDVILNLENVHEPKREVEATSGNPARTTP